MTTPRRIIRLPAVIARVAMARATIYRKIKLNKFPAQVDMDGAVASISPLPPYFRKVWRLLCECDDDFARDGGSPAFAPLHAGLRMAGHD